jgi:hypothetical protein
MERRMLEEFWPGRRMWCFDELCPRPREVRGTR